MNKRDKTIYWILTIIVVLPMTLSGIPELFLNGPETAVKNLLFLGYPMYLLKILGFAKILGGIAILSGKSPRIKEWAYAGYSIDLLGAAASHIIMNDFANAPPSIAFFILLMGSYYYWTKQYKLVPAGN